MASGSGTGLTAGGGGGSNSFKNFEKLVRDSTALLSDIEGGGAPVLQRNLAQLDAASRRLALSNPKAADPYSAAQAQMYFARKGVDIGKQSKTLEKIDLSRAYEPTDLAVAELDLVKFLDHHHHLLINTCIEEATKMTSNAFRKHYIGKMDDDWERAKRDILERVGFRSGSKGLNSAFALTNASSAMVTGSPKSASAAMVGGSKTTHPLSLNSAGAPPGMVTASGSSGALTNGTSAPARLMSIEQQRYANVIGVLNDKRALERGAPFGLVTTLRDTAKSIDEYNDKKGTDSDVVLTWELLREMIGEENVVNGVFLNPNGSGAAPAGSSHVLTERMFARDYARQSLALRNRLIGGSRRFLAHEFKLYLDAVVSNAPPQRKEGTAAVVGAAATAAAASGAGPLNAVRTFLNAIYQRNVTDNSPSTPWPNFQTDICDRYPFWAQIYFLFRSGQIKVMLEFVDRVEKELNLAFNKFFKTTRDPYKLVMYFIVGRFKGAEIDHARSYVATTVEDYFWLRLTTLWENEEPLPDWLVGEKKEAPQYSLAALQAENLQLGEKHYNSDGRAPLRYFKVLILSQQFEQAIAYIVRTDYFLMGVHYALALDYYGLLHRAQPTQDLWMRSASGTEHVNLYRIIRRYTDPFARTHQLHAFHYLYLLRPSASGAAAAGSAAASMFGTPAAASKSLLSPAVGKDSKDDMAMDPPLQPKWNEQVFEAMVDLIVETKEYDALIGVMRERAMQKNGAMYRYFPANEAQHIIVLSAERAEASGWHGDAIRLLQLAEKFDRVSVLCTKRLSRVVSAPAHHSERVEMLDLTRRFLAFLSTAQEHIKQLPTPSKATSSGGAAAAPSPFKPGSVSAAAAASQAHAVTSDKLTALHSLLRLAHFFDLYHLGVDHYEDAIIAMEQIGLVPTTLSRSAAGGADDELEAAVTRFSRLDDSVRRVLADVSVALMEMYHHKYKAIRDQKITARDPARQKILEVYRDKAKALVNFIGLHHALVGAEVNSKLVRLESFMS